MTTERGGGIVLIRDLVCPVGITERVISQTKSVTLCYEKKCLPEAITYISVVGIAIRTLGTIIGIKHLRTITVQCENST